MKRVLIAFIIVFFFANSHVTVFAHLGGGPPFLKVNGKDADTNPLNQGASTFTIPWDLPPETYLVNIPVNFIVDVAELMKATTVPAELAKDIRFRWSIATGDNFENKQNESSTVNSLSKTFNKSGSYLVIIEAKLPKDSDFILIDTVQINIVPEQSYQLPYASVFLGTQYDDLKKNVFLLSDGGSDASTKIEKYLWDFGDGKLLEGISVQRRFEKAETLGVEQIFHRVIDANGFIADIGFIAENKNDKLQFSPFISEKNLLVTVGTYEQAAERAGKTESKLSMPQFVGVAFGVIFVLGAIMWFVIKYTKIGGRKHTHKS